MLGYGTIVVIGTGGTPQPFHKVAHPLEFRSQVQKQIEKLQKVRESARVPIARCTLHGGTRRIRDRNQSLWNALRFVPLTDFYALLHRA